MTDSYEFNTIFKSSEDTIGFIKKCFGFSDGMYSKWYKGHPFIDGKIYIDKSYLYNEQDLGLIDFNDPKIDGIYYKYDLNTYYISVIPIVITDDVSSNNSTAGNNVTFITNDILKLYNANNSVLVLHDKYSSIKVPYIITNEIQAVENALNTVVNTVEDIVVNTVEDAVNSVNTVNTVVNTVENIVNTVENIANNVNTVVNTVVDTVVNTVINTVEDAVNNVNTVNTVEDALISSLEDIVNNVNTVNTVETIVFSDEEYDFSEFDAWELRESNIDVTNPLIIDEVVENTVNTISYKPIYISPEIFGLLRPESLMNWETIIQISMFGDILYDNVKLSPTMIQAIYTIKNGDMLYDDLIIYLMHPEHHNLISQWIDNFLMVNGIREGFITELCDFISSLGYSNVYVRTTVQGIMQDLLNNGR